MNDRIEGDIRKSEQLIQWLDSKLDGLEYQSDHRKHLASGCLDMALEHHKSIVLLTGHSLYGSAAALVRLEFEAYVRGIWLLHCASDSELDRFKRDRLDKSFGQLIEEIEKVEAFDVGVLSHVKNTSWATMNSFTHSGILQVSSRSRGDEITPNYSNEQLVDALSTADSLGILTALAIASMAGNQELSQAVFDRGQKFFDTEATYRR